MCPLAAWWLQPHARNGYARDMSFKLSGIHEAFQVPSISNTDEGDCEYRLALRV